MAINLQNDIGRQMYNRPAVTYYVESTSDAVPDVDPRNKVIDFSEVESSYPQLQYYLGPTGYAVDCTKDIKLYYDYDTDKFLNSDTNILHVWVRLGAVAVNISHPSTPRDGVVTAPSVDSIGDSRVNIEEVEWYSPIFDTGYTYDWHQLITGECPLQVHSCTGGDAIPISGIADYFNTHRGNLWSGVSAGVIAHYQWGYYEDSYGSNHYRDSYVGGIWARYKITVNKANIDPKTDRAIKLTFPVYIQTANACVQWGGTENDPPSDPSLRYTIGSVVFTIRLNTEDVELPEVETKYYWNYDFPSQKLTSTQKAYINSIYNLKYTKPDTVIADHQLGISLFSSTGVEVVPSIEGMTSSKKDIVRKWILQNYPLIQQANVKLTQAAWDTDMATYLSKFWVSDIDAVQWTDDYPGPFLSLACHNKNTNYGYDKSTNRDIVGVFAPSTLKYRCYCNGKEKGSQMIILKYGDYLSGYMVYKTPHLTNRCDGTDLGIQEFITGVDSSCVILFPCQGGYKGPSTYEDMALISDWNATDTNSKEPTKWTFEILDKDEEKLLFTWTIYVYRKSLYSGVTDPNTLLNQKEEYEDPLDSLRDQDTKGSDANPSLVCYDTNEGTSYSSTSLLFKSNKANIYKTISSKDQVLFGANYVQENDSLALYNELTQTFKNSYTGFLSITASAIDQQDPDTESSLLLTQNGYNLSGSINLNNLLKNAISQQSKDEGNTYTKFYGLAFKLGTQKEPVACFRITESGTFESVYQSSLFSSLSISPSSKFLSIGKKANYFDDWIHSEVQIGDANRRGIMRTVFLPDQLNVFNYYAYIDTLYDTELSCNIKGVVSDRVQQADLFEVKKYGTSRQETFSVTVTYEDEDWTPINYKYLRLVAIGNNKIYFKVEDTAWFTSNSQLSLWITVMPLPVISTISVQIDITSISLFNYSRGDEFTVEMDDTFWKSVENAIIAKEPLYWTIFGKFLKNHFFTDFSWQIRAGIYQDTTIEAITPNYMVGIISNIIFKKPQYEENSESMWYHTDGIVIPKGISTTKSALIFVLNGQMSNSIDESIIPYMYPESSWNLFECTSPNMTPEYSHGIISGPTCLYITVDDNGVGHCKPGILTVEEGKTTISPFEGITYDSFATTIPITVEALCVDKYTDAVDFKIKGITLVSSSEKVKTYNVAKVSTDQDYSYTPYLNNSSQEKRIFKAGEEYQLGVVFKYQDGSCSAVMPLSYKDTSGVDQGFNDVWVPTIEPEITEIPRDTQSGVNALKDLTGKELSYIKGIKPVRVTSFHPYVSSILANHNVASIIPVRLIQSNPKIKCQGILNPGITTTDLKNTIGVDAQYDWFYRETFMNHSVKHASYQKDSSSKDDNSTNKQVTIPEAAVNCSDTYANTFWESGSESGYAPKWEPNFEIEIQNLDDESRESGEVGLSSSGTLLTMNSPEFEMDEAWQQYMLQGTQLKHIRTYNNLHYSNNVELQYNGSNRLSSFETQDVYLRTGTISSTSGLGLVYPEQTEDSVYDNPNSGQVSLHSMRHHKFKSGFLWYGYFPNGVTSEEDAIKEATRVTDITENYAFFKVYPWMRNRLGGEVGDEYTIKTKRYFSQTYAEGDTYYSPSNSEVYISGVTISNSQTNVIHKLYNPASTTNNTVLYQGTTDAMVVASAFSSDGVYKIRCRGDFQNITFNSSDGSIAHSSEAGTKNDTTGYITSIDWAKTRPNSYAWTAGAYDSDTKKRDYAPSIGGIQGKYCRDPISIKYKAAPHAVFFFTGGSMSTNKNGIHVGQLYDPNERDAPQISQWTSGTWVPCGRQVPISEDNTPTEIVFEEGDFFFGRFDSLRTQPYTDDDINQVTEVVSTMLCSRINLDARYDSNRGVKTPTITNTNFNLRNTVYDQVNNYINYSYQDYTDLISYRQYKSTIQWSLAKTMGEDIDTWCNIQDTNFLDVNGDLGSIISINKLGNNLIIFQEKGIAVLQYNEKTQVATNTGIPVEIANSGKVQGKYYISQCIGCQNVHAIAETPSGIFFIDSMLKTMYFLAPNLEMKDLSIQGLKAWSKKNLDINWQVKYDEIAEEVLFINDKEALVYNIAYQKFSSFLGYGNIKHWFRLGPYTCQVKPLNYVQVMDIEQITGIDSAMFSANTTIDNKSSIWFRNTQEACSLFGNKAPQTIEWICNPTPVNDKTFTTISYRADAFCTDDTYISDDTFDVIRLVDEYQDTQKDILYWKAHTSSNLKKKFRIWNIALPRAKNTTDVEGEYSYTRDRIRNMWCKVQLKHDSYLLNKKTDHTSKGYWQQIPFKSTSTTGLINLDTEDTGTVYTGTTAPDRNDTKYQEGDIYNLVDTEGNILHKYTFHESARFVFYDAQVSYLPS